MKRLILMRHAKSDWSFDQPDHDRPLNARGERSARALGAWLRQYNYVPQAALVSSATRTQQTWAGLDLPITPIVDRGLYHAEPAAMLTALQSVPEDVVLMLGHNPGIALLAHMLVEDPPAHDRFDDYPTGATLVVDFVASSWENAGGKAGVPVAFVVARDLTD